MHSRIYWNTKCTLSLQVRNFIDIFMPIGFLIKIFALKINKHLNYWIIIPINCNISHNTSDFRRTDLTLGLKVGLRAEQGPGGRMQAFSLQNGQSTNRDVCGKLVPQKGWPGTPQEQLKAGSSLCGLLQTSACQALWGTAAAPGSQLHKSPSATLPEAVLLWAQSISLWSCA